MRYLMLGILLGFPVLEGTVMYKIGQGHALWVLAWLVLAASLGIALIKEARFALVARVAASLARGQFSLSAFIDSGRTVLAGLFLIFPGLVSDIIALVLLLLPVGRADHDSPYRVNGGINGGVIEGEFRRES